MANPDEVLRLSEALIQDPRRMAEACAELREEAEALFHWLDTCSLMIAAHAARGDLSDSDRESLDNLIEAHTELAEAAARRILDEEEADRHEKEHEAGEQRAERKRFDRGET